MSYSGFSAPAAEAIFHLLSFKSEKSSTLPGDMFHCHKNFGVYCHSNYMLSVKLVTFWILRKYSFGTKDGN